MDYISTNLCCLGKLNRFLLCAKITDKSLFCFQLQLDVFSPILIIPTLLVISISHYYVAWAVSVLTPIALLLYYRSWRRNPNRARTRFFFSWGLGKFCPFTCYHSRGGGGGGGGSAQSSTQLSQRNSSLDNSLSQCTFLLRSESLLWAELNPDLYQTRLPDLCFPQSIDGFQLAFSQILSV